MTNRTDVTNHDRATWANAALYRFRQLTGCDHEDALGDLLCDLMHWSTEHNFDFTAALDRARSHHWSEVLDEMPKPAKPYDSRPDLLAALEQAVAALNTVPRFPVPSLLTDSCRIASTCDRAIAKAKEAGQ